MTPTFDIHHVSRTLSIHLQICRCCWPVYVNWRWKRYINNKWWSGITFQCSVSPSWYKNKLWHCTFAEVMHQCCVRFFLRPFSSRWRTTPAKQGSGKHLHLPSVRKDPHPPPPCLHHYVSHIASSSSLQNRGRPWVFIVITMVKIRNIQLNLPVSWLWVI